MTKIWIGLLLLFFSASHAQKSELNLKEYNNLLNRFHNYVDKGELAGTVIFLEKNGQLTKDTYGYQNIENQAPMKENTVFRIASMTKPLIATAIMQLVEREKLKLDDPVSNFIPKVGQMTTFDGSKDGRVTHKTITIKHLLTHTSGITSMFDFSDAGRAATKIISKSKVANLQELVEVICLTQLAFEPGEGWAYGYSNDLLAYVIEKVTDSPIDLYLEEHIFQPLEMAHTSFHVADTLSFTSIYAPDSLKNLIAIETSSKNKYVNGKNIARGNGGLVSTAGDYLNFCRMILNLGFYKGKRILKAETVKMMTKNYVDSRYFPIKVASTELLGQGYGFGFGVVLKNSPFGTAKDIYWPGSLYTYFFVSPENNGIGIFMTQLYDRTRMSMIWEFHDLATKALK